MSGLPPFEDFEPSRLTVWIGCTVALMPIILILGLIVWAAVEVLR